MLKLEQLSSAHTVSALDIHQQARKLFKALVKFIWWRLAKATLQDTHLGYLL